MSPQDDRVQNPETAVMAYGKLIHDKGTETFSRSIVGSEHTSHMTPWTVAHQAPLSMERSRQEYWSELPFPTPEDLPNPGIKPRSSALQADSLLSEPPGKAASQIVGKE